jgi:hypothetical protein
MQRRDAGPDTSVGDVEAEAPQPADAASDAVMLDAASESEPDEDPPPPPDPQPAGRKAASPGGAGAPAPAGKNAPPSGGTGGAGTADAGTGAAGTSAPAPAGTSAPPPGGMSAPPPGGMSAPPPGGMSAPPPAGMSAPPPEPQPCNPMDSRYDDDRFDACTTGEVCVIDSTSVPSRSECVATERKPEGTPGASCSVDDECADGNLCWLDHGCVDICLIGGSSCPEKQACIGLAAPLIVAGSEFGHCACPGVASGFCSPLTQCGCSDGLKCDWLDGRATCMSAGMGLFGSACTTPADCAAGTSCEAGSCHYLCDISQAGACGSGTCQAPGVCRGGFSSSCQNIQFSSPTLTADCRLADQMTWTMASGIDLGFWVANDNGVLNVRPNGGFIGSCPEHNVTTGEGGRVTLNANCPRSDGVFSWVSVELADKLANIDGVLVFN